MINADNRDGDSDCVVTSLTTFFFYLLDHPAQKSSTSSVHLWFVPSYYQRQFIDVGVLQMY